VWSSYTDSRTDSHTESWGDRETEISTGGQTLIQTPVVTDLVRVMQVL